MTATPQIQSNNTGNGSGSGSAAGGSILGPAGAGGGAGGAGGGNNSNTSKEARIHARRIRIEAVRLAKIKPDKVDDAEQRRKPKVETEKKDTGKARAQMSASNKKIDSIKLSTTELVTNLRVGVVARESQRRHDDLKRQETWSQKRASDEQRTRDMHARISAQWEPVLAKVQPYELHEMLLTQREACAALMASKDRLVNEYCVDLKGKDDDYVKELKRQAEEIDILIERMEEQYRSLQTTLKEELDHIERSFIEERTELIESNMKEIEALFSQRRDNEGKYLEDRADRIEDHVKQLEALRVRDAEEYNLVKIKLETDVQVLEQQLQQMRATYQLNTEKLEYNFQVLKKREEENASILGTQKRKITRLTDHLNSLKSKMSKQEKTYHTEHVNLTDDYKRILEQYKELQKKFRDFQVSDGLKYGEIWDMNEEATRELMRKVIAADRIVVEQQLGMKWEGPQGGEEVFKSLGADFFRGRRGLKGGDKDERAQLMSIGAAGSVGDENGDGGTCARVGGGAAGMLGGRESLAAKFKETKLGGNASVGYSKTMKRMLELLCNEAGFLVEEKLQKLLAPLHKDEQSLMKLDSIFKALSVETVEDIEKLTSFFVARDAAPTPGGGQTVVATAAPSTIGEDGSPASVPVLSHTTALIHPNDVIRAIRKFVEDHHFEKALGTKKNVDFLDDKEEYKENVAERDSEQGSGEGGDALTDGESGTIGSARHRTAAAKTKNDQQRQYWERMANVIDDKSYRIWTAVYYAMKKYNSLLTERYQLTQDIESVHGQNEELKNLLRQYMSAKVNDELQVPPTQIMWYAAGGNMLG
ncbi:sperm tail-domain-containing protein [Chytriomyces sp. MP71]|nr:sperm tail-domain-containing protein [Chytriomyces sp. MP71]